MFPMKFLAKYSISSVSLSYNVGSLTIWCCDGNLFGGFASKHVRKLISAVIKYIFYHYF